MTTDAVEKTARRLPILQGFLPLDRARIRLDIVAGITLAALAIPEVMGYTQIAGMPVVTGLYTILIPMALFAIFGSSRHLVVGADSATAAIMAAGLAGMRARWGETVKHRALKALKADFAHGHHKDNQRALEKLTRRVDGQIRIAPNPPLVIPVEDLVPDAEQDQIEEIIRGLLRKYPVEFARQLPALT